MEDLCELKTRIAKLKEALYKVLAEEIRNSDRVVALSQELDREIILYLRCSHRVTEPF